MPSHCIASSPVFRQARRFLTGQFAGLSLKKTLWGILLLGIAVYLITSFQGFPEAFKKLESAGLGVASSAIAFVFVFLLSLLRAPYNLEEDASAAAKKASDDLRASLDALRTEIDQLGQLMRDRESKHQTEVANINKAVEQKHAENERQRYANPERNAIRDACENWLTECEFLPTETSRSEDVHKLYAIEHTAAHYLERHLPAYKRFNTPYPIRDSHSSQASRPEFQEYPARRAAGIEKFKDILRMLG